ncbi:MAG: SulP family inorganic anion transporter [Planctomycetota bacterium]|nr:SulP family inorganic anion transporter [Planctomycetota bacterium]
MKCIPRYSVAYLLKDAVAGLVLTAILLPAGMGYAQAAGLPAIHGLYSTIVALVAYAIFGPSRLLVVGPDSSLAALIAATILPLAGGNVERAVALAGALSVMTGIICVIAGLAKFGFVTELISKPIRYGYINGIAFTVIAGQLPAFFGFSVSVAAFPQEMIAFINGLFQGQVNLAAVIIGATCMIVIFGCKYWAPVIPGVLIAVVGATLAVVFIRPLENAHLSVVSTLPQGLPDLRIPNVSLQDLRDMLRGSIAIALVAFADSSVLSRIYSQRGGYSVESNKELVSLGITNMATGLFQGFSVSVSASRTPVAEQAGAKTQVTGLFGALLVTLLLFFAPALLKSMPHAALSAVVICACLGQIQIYEVVRLYQLRRSELIFSIACFLGVILLGVIQGIFIAVGLALIAFIWRAWRPHNAVLGRVDGLKGYHDVLRHPEARRIPGLVLFRWDAPLFFANAAVFEERVQQAIALAPTPTKWVVVAAEPVTDVDITAADMLADLDKKLHLAGMDLCFAEMKGPVKDILKRYGLFDSLGNENFFPTIGQAVDRYLDAHKVTWQDWDETAADI